MEGDNLPPVHSSFVNTNGSIFYYASFSSQDHVSSMETLKDELQLVAEKKSELERRLQQSMRERDSLNAALEEGSDRIHSLERHAREQETKLQVGNASEFHLPIISILCSVIAVGEVPRCVALLIEM